jgi:hypothetical protein
LIFNASFSGNDTAAGGGVTVSTRRFYSCASAHNDRNKVDTNTDLMVVSLGFFRTANIGMRIYSGYPKTLKDDKNQ